jgi:hypothetical protein
MKIYMITFALLFNVLSTHELFYLELNDHEQELHQLMSKFSNYMGGLLNNMNVYKPYDESENGFSIECLTCSVQIGPGKVTVTSDSISLEQQMLDYNLLVEYSIDRERSTEPYHYLADMKGKLSMESTITYYFNKPIGQRLVITDARIGVDLSGQVTTVIDDGMYSGDKEKFAKDLLYDDFVNDKVLGLTTAFTEFTKDK